MFTLTTPRIGEILQESGAITAEQLAEAVELQSLTHVRLGSILVANNLVSEEQVTAAVSVQMDVPYIDVAKAKLEPNCIALIPNEIAKRYQLLPLSVYDHDEDGKPVLRVAMVNPWDIEAIDLVQRISWHRVESILASKSGMAEALERAYQLAEETQTSLRLDETNPKIMLQQMLENSLEQSRRNLQELETMRQYLESM